MKLYYLLCTLFTCILLCQCDYEEKRQKNLADFRSALMDDSLIPTTDEQKLWCAAAMQDLQTVEELLAAGCKADISIKEGQYHHSPLTISIARGPDNDVTKALLAQGAELTVGEGEQELSALHRAAFLGKAELAEQILQHGGEVNRLSHSGETRMDKEKHTPFMLGCMSYLCGRQADSLLSAPWDMEALLLSHGADINLQTENLRRSALHYAILNRHTDPLYINYLCEAGANVNAQDKWGMTPLMYCYLYREPLFIEQVLRRHGVDANLKNIFGYTAAEVRCLHQGGEFPEGSSAAFQAFVQLWRLCLSKTPFDRAAAESLLPSIENINALGTSGKTLLWSAVQTQNVAAVRWLLEHGAEPNTLLVDASPPAGFHDERDTESYTVLRDAMMGGNTEPIRTEIIRLLIEAGANTEKVLHHTVTGLGSVGESLELYMLFLKDRAHEMPKELLYALLTKASYELEQEDFEILYSYLISDRSLNINTPDSQGYTLLLRYCATNLTLDYRILDYLIKQGADASATLADGRTALMLLLSRHRYTEHDFIKSLIHAGCPINAVDNQENGGLHYIFKLDDYGRISADELLQCLIELGAKTEQINKSGQSVLHAMQEYAALEKLRIPLSNYLSETPTQMRNWEKKVQQMLDILETNSENPKEPSL